MLVISQAMIPMSHWKTKMEVFIHFIVLAVFLSPMAWSMSHDRRSVRFRFSQYYQDHMVLQRTNHGTTVWGYSSNPGDVVHVKIDSKEVANTTVDNNNVWTAKFPSPTQGNGPYNVTATSSQGEISIHDVLFGDVWACSGQSNMAYFVRDLENATEEYQDTGSYQQIRVFKLRQVFSNTTLNDIKSVAIGWSPPSQKSITYFSAVCWLYGKYLSEHLNYPIGLVETDWGGTRIEAWSSPDALSSCSSSGRKRNQNSESELYNAMIYPLLRNTIKGAIWYQGESNVGHYAKYACQFPAMITDWRHKFNTFSLGTSSVNFPFGFVQLAPYRQVDNVHAMPDQRWAQTANVGYVPNSKMPNTFMAVAMDLPDFSSPRGAIHPRYKHDIARRLVLSSLAVAYHQKGIEYQGPFPSSYKLDANHHSLTVEFDHGRTPIEVRNNTGFDVCCASHGHVCNDFDPGWGPVPIMTHTTSSVILDTSTCHNSIGGIRYTWRESPCVFRKCPVYGRDNNLPAPPFKYLANIQ